MRLKSGTGLAALALATIAVPGVSLAQSADKPSLVEMTPAREKIVPLADHHQHLTSPLEASAEAPAPLPEVKLPAGLAELLRKRGTLWRDARALRALYTPDAEVLAIRFPTWTRGAEQSAWALGWIAGPFYKEYRLRPASYRIEGARARIDGYYMDVGGENPAQIGFFHIDASRDRRGIWRIATEVPSFPSRRSGKTLDGDDLVKLLDEAGIQRAVVLSQAYSFDGLVPAPGDAYANVRAENDWAAAQVRRHPDRLVAFCSFNPTLDHALVEIERCAKDPAFTGVKLHFGTSPVDLDNPDDVAKTRRVFEAANRLGLPILVHLTASPEWGERQARIFLQQLVAAAPDVQVVVAHLWGGAWYNEGALAYLAHAVASGDPAAKNLYFEVAQAAEVARGKPETLQAIARHMREIGLTRIYYGSDGALPPGIPPKDSWAKFRHDVPLTDDELRIFANNVAPWTRPRSIPR